MLTEGELREIDELLGRHYHHAAARLLVEVRRLQARITALEEKYDAAKLALTVLAWKDDDDD